ncbi:transmembrane and coiled-coil domains protein 2 [Lucilia cuprina]|uniref:transmembrane and coiled-coil domains protein 2 n=1 Tax=Lucilia cuprina TaxID=7375 RepID=UPI001F070F6C|nr:transmembrane and coiled-coil domains protein 2 [Lucilia cuprina]
MNTTTVSRERDHHTHHHHQRGDSAESTSSAAGVTFSPSTTATAGATAASIAGLTPPTATSATSSSGTMTGSVGSGGGVGVVGVSAFRGFRSQSPSNRRSRERNRTHARTHGSDQGGLLAYHGGMGVSGMSLGGVGGDLTNMDIGLSSAGGSGGITEDSRLSGNEDLCYQSFVSDDLDGNPHGSLGDTSKKHHRRHERTLSLQALDRLNTKIQCTKESIRKEQTARDDNVNEYLKLAASADKQQLQRIKSLQNEIENLKQAIADMEEKVQYQSDERLQDVNEVLENCQTRISKMEHLSQQQYVTVEGIDNSNARALVVKLINVVLTILQVVLLLVATAAGIIMPFLKTRVRVLTTFLSIFLIICVIRQWPDVQDIGAGLLRHLKQSLVVK